MSEIEERCLSLPNKEKVRLIDTLRKSLETKDSGKTFEKMHDAIVKVMGCEVITKGRELYPAIGRALLAYACSLEGMTEHTIGRLLQRDHSSIHAMKKRVRGWLNLPHVFKIENDFYVEFLKELNNETDR